MSTVAARTELLIVPTHHLDSSTSEGDVARARDRLAAWAPDLVAVENLPGHLVVEYEQRGGVFADFPVGGAGAARRGAAAIGAAPGEVWEGRRTGADPHANLTERVLGWLRAREPLNALLLPWQDADLPDPAAAFLTELAAWPGESVRISARIARDAGHQQLAHIDDHLGVENLEPAPPDLDADLQAHREQIDHLLQEVTPPEHIAGDLWQRWLHYSSPAVTATVERLETSEYFGDGTRTTPGRRLKLANWRARNLAMAARLRSATATVPGGRVLLVVGSSHHGPLQAALGPEQADLRLVDLADLEPSSGRGSAD